MADKADRPPPRTANGFTLVELMAVLAVLALASGAVVLILAGGDDGPRPAAARFAARLAAARDEAIVTARPIQAWASPSGFGFDQYRSGRWQPLEQRPLETANWPEGTELSGAVRLRFDSLGLPDGPAALTLSRGGRSNVVRLDADGDVTVH